MRRTEASGSENSPLTLALIGLWRLVSRGYQEIMAREWKEAARSSLYDEGGGIIGWVSKGGGGDARLRITASSAANNDLIHCGTK